MAVCAMAGVDDAPPTASVRDMPGDLLGTVVPGVRAVALQALPVASSS